MAPGEAASRGRAAEVWGLRPGAEDPRHLGGAVAASLAAERVQKVGLA